MGSEMCIRDSLCSRLCPCDGVAGALVRGSRFGEAAHIFETVCGDHHEALDAFLAGGLWQSAARVAHCTTRSGLVFVSG